ncbi:MAG: GNAT family N-acetyltransferase [Thermoplasmatota archaeon]
MALGVAVAAYDGTQPLGVAFLTIYGPLGWIGNVVVSPTARGRGVGEGILRRLLAAASERKVETVRLYSVPKAVGLYRRVGFVEEGSVHALYAEALRETPNRDRAVAASSKSQRGVGVLEVKAADVAAWIPGVVAFDALAFGAPRDALLRSLLADPRATLFILSGDIQDPPLPARSRAPERGAEVRGYLIRRAGATTELGPGVVRGASPEDAWALLDHAIARATTPVEMGIPAENPTATRWAHERGFVQAFEGTRMRWGADRYRGNPTSIVAAGGLEKG